MIFYILFSIVIFILLMQTLKKPSVAIVGVWCMYSIEQWAQGSNIFFIHHKTVINIIVGCIVLFGVAIAFFKEKHIFRNYPKIAFLILGLFFYSYISIVWTKEMDLSYEVWSKYWPYLITFLLLSPLLITKEEDLKSVFRVFLIIGAIVVYALFFHVDWSFRQIIFIGSTFSNKILGNPLAVAQMAGYLFLASIFYRNIEKPFGLWVTLLKWILAIACLLLIIKSGSRGQLLGVVVTLLILWPMTYKINNIKGFVGICLVSMIIIGASVWALETFWSGNSRWDQDEMENSIGGRLDNAFVLLNYWFKDPLVILFGLGNSASYDPKILGIYPHFVPFEILGEEGIVGFFIYLLILLGIYKMTLRMYSLTNEDIVSRQYFVIFLAMVLYSFILSLKQGSLLGNMEFFMAIIILGKYELIIKSKINRFENNGINKI